MYVRVSKVLYFEEKGSEFTDWWRLRHKQEVNPAAPSFTSSHLFASNVLVLTSVLQLASCIYQLLTKLHYHYSLNVRLALISQMFHQLTCNSCWHQWIGGRKNSVSAYKATKQLIFYSISSIINVMSCSKVHTTAHKNKSASTKIGAEVNFSAGPRSLISRFTMCFTGLSKKSEKNNYKMTQRNYYFFALKNTKAALGPPVAYWSY